MQAGTHDRDLLSTSDRAPVGNAFANMIPVGVASWTAPIAAGAAVMKAATATVAAPVSLDASDLLAGGIAALLADDGKGRQLSFTTAGSTPADAPATATITGILSNGEEATETVTLAQTATVANGTKFWREITAIDYPAADGTDATIAIGITANLGLPAKPAVRNGRYLTIAERTDGAAPTAGALIAPSAAAPNGGYTPNSAANASRDYDLFYEVEPAAA